MYSVEEAKLERMLLAATRARDFLLNKRAQACANKDVATLRELISPLADLDIAISFIRQTLDPEEKP